MKRSIHAALFIIILLSSSEGFTQSKKSARAYEIFEAGEYYLAIDEFKDAYEKTMSKSDKLDVAFNIAECYRLTNNPASAELWYGKVLAKNYPNPLAILYYADALKMNQKYEIIHYL